MTEMFSSATKFNRNISNWVVSNVAYCLDFSTGANNGNGLGSYQPNFTNCYT